MDGPTGGKFEGRITWQRPHIPGSGIAAGAGFTEDRWGSEVSPATGQRLARTLAEGALALTEANDLAERLERMVPPGFHVTGTYLRLAELGILVTLVFEVDDPPEQMTAVDHEDVPVSHPAGAVTVPVERARAAYLTPVEDPDGDFTAALIAAANDEDDRS